MAHLADTLPLEVEIGAVRREDYGTEIVPLDGGGEVRNSLWSEPLRVFEISYPTARRDDPVYLAVKALYTSALGSLHSFNFTDWTDETGATILAVRFDSPLEIVGVAGHLDHIVSMTLREVRLPA